MKAKDLVREVEEFRTALVAHRDLYAQSVDIMVDDYPIDNLEELRTQSRQLNEMVGRLQPYLRRFGTSFSARETLTGQTVDVLVAAVGMGHDVQIKGQALEHAIDGADQVIGSLKRFG